jgi:rifampicin phosphotransferase
VRHITVLRQLLLLLGERLHQQEVLAHPDDVFFLEIFELELAGTGGAQFDVQELVAARRAEYARNQKLNPPFVVKGRYDPATEPAPNQDPRAQVLTGIPIYPGTVTGRARVILRSDDHEQVEPGEILVAPFTDPAWTPYFIPAAGVVVDQGGVLSHGSIIAREYGLPAVTNVRLATRIIRTGDRIEVDGRSGRVTIWERIKG